MEYGKPMGDDGTPAEFRSRTDRPEPAINVRREDSSGTKTDDKSAEPDAADTNEDDGA